MVVMMVGSKATDYVIDFQTFYFLFLTGSACVAEESQANGTKGKQAVPKGLKER